MSNIRVRSRLSITDLNDQISGATAPSNPEEKSLWLDTSVSPPILKYWDGSVWIPQRLDISELDPDLSITIETIEATMGNMANDNILDIKERGIIVDNINEIIGYLISNKTNAPATLPSVATLDASKKGNFYQTRATARNAGISTSAISYVAVGTAYNALASYLGNMTPIKPWDITDLNKDKNVTVVKDTFRQTWLNYYLAVQKLVEDTALQVKSQIDDHENRITTVSAGFETLKDSIKLYATKDEVKNSLTAYPTKTEMDAQLNVKADEINLGIQTTITGLSSSDKNLLLKSNVPASNQSYMIKSYNMSEMMVEGEDYVFRAKMTLGSGKTWAGIWLDGGLITLQGRLTKDTDGTYYAKFKGKKGANTTTNILHVYIGEGTVSGVTSSIEWAKLTKSNILFKQWTPAPEDTDDSINNSLAESKTYTNAQIKLSTENINLGIKKVEESVTKVSDSFNNLQIGNRNYFSTKAWDSKPNLTASAVPYMDIKLEANTEYTLSTNIPMQTNGQYDVFLFKGTDAPSSNLNGVAKERPRSITTNTDGILKVAMRSYNLSNGYWIMLAKGNKALDWQPAIEDNMLYTGYSNSPDGTVNFSRTYPNENLLVQRKITIGDNVGITVPTYPLSTLVSTPTKSMKITELNDNGFKITLTGTSDPYFRPINDVRANQYGFDKIGVSFKYEVSSDSRIRVRLIGFNGTGTNSTTYYTGKGQVNELVSIVSSNNLTYVSIDVIASNGSAGIVGSEAIITELKISNGDALPYTTSPKDNIVKSEMLYIGYSPTNSNNPSDYVWIENPKARGTFIAYANSLDGSVDFTKKYPEYNQFSISNAVIDAYLGNYEYTFEFKSATTAPISFTHANPIKLKAGTYVFSYEGRIPVSQPSVSSLRFSTSSDNIAFTTLSGVGYLGQTKMSSEWSKFTATATLTQDAYIGIQVYSHMFGADYNTKVDVRNIVIREGSDATFMPSPKDDAIRAEMKYIGYSSKDSTNPYDYAWSENPKTKGNIVRYANSPDGKVDFTDIYPNENLFPNTKLLDTRDVNASMDTVVFNGDETVTLRKRTVTTSRMFWNNSPITNIQPDPNRVYSAQIDIFIENGFTSIAGSSFFLRTYNSSGTAMDFASVDLTGIPSNQWVTLKITNAKPNGGSIPSKGMQFCVALSNNALGTIRLRKPKLEYGAVNTLQNTNKNEDPVRAEMAYIGYSFKDSNDPSDFTWYENPKAKGTFKRWSNSPDGTLDFTDTYPNENLFAITRPEVTNPATTSTEFLNNPNWDMAPIFEIYGINIAYTLSFDLKSAIAGAISVYSQNGSGTKYNIGQTIVQATTEYKRYSITIIPQLQANSTETRALLAFYGTYNTGRTPTVKNLKLELGAKATIDTPSPSEDLLATIPKYVGISNKNSNNPSDYVWNLSPEYNQAITYTSVKEVELQLTPDSIYAKVSEAPDYIVWKELVDSKPSIDDLSNVYDQLEGLSSADETILASMAELEVANNGVLTSITQALEGMDGTLSTITDYMFFGTSGLTIGKSDSPMKVNISNTELAFYDNSTKVAWVDSQRLNIREALIEKKIKVGNHIIEKFDDKEEITIFKYDGV